MPMKVYLVYILPRSSSKVYNKSLAGQKLFLTLSMIPRILVSFTRIYLFFFFFEEESSKNLGTSNSCCKWQSNRIVWQDRSKTSFISFCLPRRIVIWFFFVLLSLLASARNQGIFFKARGPINLEINSLEVQPLDSLKLCRVKIILQPHSLVMFLRKFDHYKQLMFTFFML